MIKAVLFDLDGVLLDSEGIYTEFWADVDRRYPTGVDGFAHVIKGTTLTEILSRYFPDETVQAEIGRMLRQQERDMRYRLFEGVDDMLGALRRRGVATAIVTSSNRRKMDALYQQLPQLAELVDTLVTDEDVTASKPDPQGYLLAARRLGVTPGEYAVVEDSLAGLRAARAAGAVVVGVPTTNPRAVIEPMCDMVLDNIGNLSDRL